MPSCRPARHIRETEAFAGEVQRYIQAQPGVTHVTSFIGGGGLRFLLVYSPENENRAYVQFLVDVDDSRKIDGLIAGIQKESGRESPERQLHRQEVSPGPGPGRADPGAVPRSRSGETAGNRRSGEESTRRRRRGGVRAQRLGRACQGRSAPTCSNSRRAATASRGSRWRRPWKPALKGAWSVSTASRAAPAAGVYPQETRLLPIIARPPLAERDDVHAINSLQIWSPVAGRMIPLSQVVQRRRSHLGRPDRDAPRSLPDLTVHADPRSGLPSQLFGRVRSKIEQIELPAGYSLEWGGEYEDSRNARAALAKPLPFVLALMVFIVVCLFNSIRATLLVWVIVPLAIIGVTAGLLLTGQPFGFMAMLGVLSLGGEQIKNSIIVLSKIRIEIDQGKPPYQAILDGSVSKLRPVLMVAVTTVLGMIPLLQDPFFGAMAVCIMFGLSFACVLTMIVMPVLYAIFFGVREPPARDAAAR